MAKYRVTPRAEEDLKSIGRYTQQHWGETQRNVYLKNLENRFNWLAKVPLMAGIELILLRDIIVFLKASTLCFICAATMV